MLWSTETGPISKRFFTVNRVLLKISMPQVKVYGLRSALAPLRTSLSEAIHAVLVDTLGTPIQKRFQRFILLDAEDFIYPDDRSEKYTIIEMSLFEGRTAETKKKLIKRLYAAIEAATGITPQDLEITLFETPAANWGIRGMPGDELSLSYKVKG